MADPFLGEVRLFTFNFAPKGWAQCNGQLLPINQNQALFSLLGTMYGGDGRVNFALPDFRGRVPVSFDNLNFNQGQRAGEEAHTITMQEMPAHNHVVSSTKTASTTAIPTSNPVVSIANSAPSELYNGSTNNLGAALPAAVSNTGGSQPHVNMQPYLVINFCIALQGIFPSRN